MPGLVEALEGLADALSIRIDEKGRRYTYDTVNEKRFLPDADACAICEDAADMDWVLDESAFLGVFGDEDGPPLHPRCGCGLEYRERRVRIYI
jgi:hypothetical protein